MQRHHRPTVLVTGGSIAGPAMAHELLRAGFAPTLLERASQPRSAGQNVDIRGPGRLVLERMGLRDAVAAAGTGEVGTQFLRPDGTVYASAPVQEQQPGHDSDGPTAELEILRGQLSALLLTATKDRMEHRYGDHVVEVTQDDGGVEVTTATDRRERYDLLVVAEGKRSATRDLVFTDEARYRDLGQYVAFGTIDRADTDDQWWQWLTATDSRVASLRPDNLGTTRATLAFLAPAMDINRLDTATQLAVLRARFADVGWQTPRIVAGFADRPEEFYFERAEQVHTPRWSTGRIAVVGDTAWGGPTGMGTTLALLGAHVLAGELATALNRAGSHLDCSGVRGALRAYEDVLRPHITKTQQLPPGVPALALPKTRWGLAALHAAHRVATSTTLRRAARHLPTRAPSTAWTPPRYPDLHS